MPGAPDPLLVFPPAVVKVMVVSASASPDGSVAPDRVNVYPVPGSNAFWGVTNASMPASAGTTLTTTLSASGPARVAVLRLTVSIRSGLEKRTAIEVSTATF